MEADVYPRRDPEKADEIDGVLGDGCSFTPPTAITPMASAPRRPRPQPAGKNRLVEVEIAPRVGSETGTIALCLEVHDLVLAKAAAGRERDWDYVEQVLKAGLADHATLLQRVPDMPLITRRKNGSRRCSLESRSALVSTTPSTD